MKLLTFILAFMLGTVPSGQVFFRQLQPRDSILVADQFEYGFQLDDVTPGEALGLPDVKEASDDTLVLVRGWRLDTLSAGKPIGGKALEKLLKSGKPFGIRATVVYSPFEEGTYHLPAIPAVRMHGDVKDTLVFEGMDIEVKTMPVDTTTYVPHDIKGQIEYPLTAREVLPWAGGSLLLAALVALAVWLIRRAVRRRRGESGRPADPAYIVALRELDKYRSDKFWAPEKQKLFYSGITDALKFYIDDRFEVDAPEMTTAELFDALKGDGDITPELFGDMKDLFELADFVKFAKHVASDEDNAKALPTAVRFVTSTYKVETVHEAETGGGVE